MAGLFIAFEGADGCGKSTQLRFMAEFLREQGVDVVSTREPGGCPVSERIRDIVLDRDIEDMSAQTEALLYAAARAQHVYEIIKPAVDAGRVVLCDRFMYSSLAYQGYGRQLGVDEVRAINEFAIMGYMPDITVFMNFSPERAFGRMNELKEYDRIEKEDMSFHERVFEGFQKLAKSPDILAIDANGTKFETHEVIKRALMPTFKQAGILD
ncbi:MAG: dTMP kinase [Clostridia bacterium]|jgi:dTMP kinase|nr:dTMP kinase [Clostridia bacterium]MBT7122872.1 dTMP kinase [Clostridia bacterium]